MKLYKCEICGNIIEKVIDKGVPVMCCGKPMVETVECPGCHKQVKKGAKFCPECGASLVAKCPKCGKEVKPGAKLCPECGEKLA